MLRELSRHVVLPWVEISGQLVLGRHGNSGQQRLYEFCYLLSFDLWTSYLVKFLFLQGCGSWFWKFPSSTTIFNELQYNLQV
jgi:hypothetical protein